MNTGVSIFNTNCLVSNLSIGWLVKLQERGGVSMMNNTTKLNGLVSKWSSYYS